MQVTDRLSGVATLPWPDLGESEGPAMRADRVSRDVGDAFEALFGPWEAQLEASLRRLSALRARLDAQAGHLSGLERELARLRPAAAGRSAPAS
jgi:hypothetical protein